MIAERLTFRYDEPSDTLYLDACEPYAEQESLNLEAGVLVRRNPRSGAVENVEILDFAVRSAKGQPLPLALAASMHLAA
ncbi:hypothetical protein BH11ARM2_BH11ARM2_13700 [soil metagenome]